MDTPCPACGSHVTFTVTLDYGARFRPDYNGITPKTGDTITRCDDCGEFVVHVEPAATPATPPAEQTPATPPAEQTPATPPAEETPATPPAEQTPATPPAEQTPATPPAEETAATPDAPTTPTAGG